MNTKTFYKKCSKCCLTKEHTLFYKCIGNVDGLNVWCKECHSAYSKQHSRKEKAAFFSKRWSDKNKEHHLATSRKWKADNKERNREYWKKYYAENRDRLVFNATKATYIRRGAVGDFSKDDIKTIFDRQMGRCVFCLKELGKYHIDHILPISRGGDNWPSNLQLACAFCNISKKDRDRPVTVPA